MKTHRFILIAAFAGTLTMALPFVLRADEVSVDISSYNPRSPEVILRQIELNVALKQYEMALTRKWELACQVDSIPRDEQDRKLKALENLTANLREKITHCIDDARKDEAEEQKKAWVNAKEEQKAKEIELLQGKWKGVEVGREAEGNCTMEITRDAIQFQGADKNEWYKATFSIVAGDPAQIHATITDCPAPDFVGKSSVAIYQIQNGTLTLHGNKPGSPEAPKGFTGDADSRTFVFKRAP